MNGGVKERIPIENFIKGISLSVARMGFEKGMWSSQFWFMNDIENITIEKDLKVNECKYSISFSQIVYFLETLDSPFWNKLTDVKFYYVSPFINVWKKRKVLEYVDSGKGSFKERFLDFLYDIESDFYVIECMMNNQLTYIAIRKGGYKIKRDWEDNLYD